MDNDRTEAQTIVGEVIIPVWKVAKLFAKNNPNILNITQGVSFVDFKTHLIKTILIDSISDYDDMTPS
jgi:hypothetical protein